MRVSGGRCWVAKRPDWPWAGSKWGLEGGIKMGEGEEEGGDATYVLDQ